MEQAMIRASAGGIIVGKGEKLVVVEQHGNSWSFPKGGIEEGETALEAALREIYEETGLFELSLLSELGTYTRYSLDITGSGEQKELGERPRTFFLFSTSQETLFPTDKEVTQARWVTIEQALELLTHPKDKEFLISVEQKVRDALQ
jgi:8-oxo-dGTP pyrophosphatase MutT (NUDIX family)